MQEIALEVTLVLVALLALAFIWVLSNASKSSDLSEFAPAGYKTRSRFFVLLLVGGVVVTVLTLPRAFVPVSATEASADVQTVTVSGYQWYWELETDEVVAGKPVEFLVTGEDVTHGFGIYDENMVMIAQTQAMPEYTNRLNVTFDKPGTYKLLCMEYCGLVHHNMVAELYVRPADASSEQ